MKIDKLGFYTSKSGDEVEIVFISKEGDNDFVAVGKEYFNGRFYIFVTYNSDEGEHQNDERHNLIGFLRPSEIEWPTPRKTSFVGYLDEDVVEDFNIKDPSHICQGINTEKYARDLRLNTTSKVSKWRFYGEEILGE